MAKAKISAAPADQTSLERLKALDTLSDLQSQLKEARQLCTHAARADMLAKWLLVKLQDDAVARAAPESWSLLDLIVRISPPERLAALLGTSDLIRTITKTMNESTEGTRVIWEVDNCLSSLFSLSEGPRSAAVKARLSTSAEKAAQLLGAWVGAMLTVEFHLKWPDRLDLCVDQVVRVWNLRKHDPHENEHFASLCLVPATALLGQLSSDGDSTRTKRKRKVQGALQADARSCLEALLAKHVFLPSRSAFFASSSQKQSKSQSAANFIPLPQRLSTIEDTIASDKLQPLSVSLLLDIALRSAPTQNSRQRLKERPWIENIFPALLACLARVEGPSKQGALTAMLKVLQVHGASLSRETLLQLATNQAISDRDEQSTNWEVLAQMILLDPTAFARVEKDGKHLDAARLFDLIAKAEEPKHGNLDLIRESVVIPIMLAFAKNRGLPAFIDLWHTQLRKTDSLSTVWLQLRESFAKLVEEHLSLNYIVDWITRLRQSTEATASVADVSDMDQGLLSANCTIVSAMLCGLQSAAYRDAVYSELDQLIEPLYSLHTSNIDKISYIWFLLRHVLELWFPTWASRQSNRATVVKRAEDIYNTTLQATAEKHLEHYATGAALSGVTLSKTRDICEYVAVASHLLKAYDPRFMDACKSVAAKANHDSMLAYLLRADSETSKNADIKRPSGHNMSHSSVPESLRSFSTLVDECTESTDQSIPMTVINSATKHLEGDLAPTEYSCILANISRYCQGAKPRAQMDMLHGLLDSNGTLSHSTIVLAKAVVSSLRRVDFADRSPADGANSPQSLMSSLLAIAGQSKSLTLVRGSLDCVALALRSKPFLTNQCVVETVMTTLKTLARRQDTHLRVLYLDISSTFTALLQHHLSRLRDRMHLMVELIQSLISCLFCRLPASDGTSKHLTARHARLLARNLQLLCSPPRLTRTWNHISDLVDEARKAQAHVGQYMQYVLHHYCVEVLGGTPGEDVREALMPGLYAMVEAMEVSNEDAIKVLGAAMNNSERAVLRSVYDDYKSFAKWRGG
ncbi:hypothetical protein LTR78_006643 [Recurvomyces mirabilis]|uniref:Nucleolar 27S pre-rRNA processing Urb2/Npa2 C-terminal domain-containing protein n=1 Tax=Recurvomyces mirabilis TaxID=574656 RepID=A0AAE0WKJ3_9PEZI|nr:hypothetical protein LTR78_006643 [Recurvomyces mirabilis]KAK5151467.1 hypothetical protein LTS14_009311 [Recurvomyces mirabilis]